MQYCGQFEYFNGETLKKEQSNIEIPDMYKAESEAFIKSVDSGIKDKNHIDYVLESAKLLELLYESSDNAGRE